MSVDQAFHESLDSGSAEILQTEKASTYPEEVSISVRMNHSTFQDRPSVATLPPSGQLDSSRNMLYQGLRSGSLADR